LLKILEEPPSHVKFIFATTEPNKVLPTIQSRCQRFDFASIGPQVIARQLDAILKIEKITFEPDFLPQLARLANGSMRDALSLLDQLISTGQQPLTAAMLEQLLGRPDAENLNLLIQHIASADPAQTLKSIEILLNQGQSASQIAESLVEMFRDMMVLKTAGDGTDILLLSCSSAVTLNQLSQTFDIPWLVFAITTLERLRWTLRNSETARALLEATLIRLAMSEQFISLDALTEQLRGGAGSAPAADIKKKTITSSGNPPLFQAAAEKSPTAQQPTPSAGQTEPGSIRDIWRQLVEKMQAQNSQIGGFLSQAHPAQLRNNILTIRFSSPLALDMIKKKDDQLRSILKDILGCEVTVQYESAKPEDAAAATPPSMPAPAGARINRQQQEQALSDPAVQMIIRGLSASPVQIDRIEESETPRREMEEPDA
jgi:DNA polymerase III subunit gamma/tau